MENVEPMVKDWVFSQELSQPDQQNVESEGPWQIPYSDTNEVQSYSRTRSSGLDLDFASSEFSETRQSSDLFSCSQYDPMNALDWNSGAEGGSPNNTTAQDVLGFDTAPASHPSAESDYESEPVIEQANGNQENRPQSSILGLKVSVKRGCVNCNPGQAKRQCRIEPLNDRKSSMAAPMGSSPTRSRTKRRRASIS